MVAPAIVLIKLTVKPVDDSVILEISGEIKRPYGTIVQRVVPARVAEKLRVQLVTNRPPPTVIRPAWSILLAERLGLDPQDVTVGVPVLPTIPP